MLNLTGKSFGKLRVLGKSYDKTEDNRVLWECSCSCGRFVLARTDHLTSGHTTSCGCSRRISTREPYKRGWHRKHYGWTRERFAEYLILQGKCCAICKEPFVSAPSADHEHKVPPKPRGLLCSLCNAAIGMLKDNSEVTQRAVEYLKFWGK